MYYNLTKEQFETLRAQYPHYSNETLSSKFGLKPTQLRRIAHLQNQLIPGSWKKSKECKAQIALEANNQKDWSKIDTTIKFNEEHDQLIAKLYPSASKEEILAALPSHITWSAVTRRAAKNNIKRELSAIHTKNYLSSGESVQDYAIRNSIPLSTANQLFNQDSEENLLLYTTSDMNRLEIKFFKLFRELPIARWNKFILEADLHYKPDFRIEFNNKILYLNIDGLFYHNNSRSRPNNYDLIMHDQFRNKNIRLMQFRSDELDDYPEVILSMVYNYFDFNISKLRASKCTIRPIESTVSQEFFRTNHLMSAIQRPTVGLFYNNELVSALSYTIQGKELEIARFANKKFHRIHGAFSKLLSFVTKKEAPSVIKSFCDLRYASGTSYRAIGFDLVGVTLSWRWTNGIRSYNRRYCRANMDDRHLSEKEHANELRLHKIFDAGQAKYLKVLDPNYSIADLDFISDESISITPSESKKVFYTIEQKALLKRLFEQKLTRSEIIKTFNLTFPDKTRNSIIRQLFNLGFTNKK